jgi:lipoprotein-releasing system ATP-binding protein
MDDIYVCENLKKQYRTGPQVVEILKGVNMTVKPGRITAVSGVSGAGKTTLLNLLGTLDRPTGGCIRFRGRDMNTLSARELNQLRNAEMGFVFQFYYLVPELTAIENVMLPGLVRGTRRIALTHRAKELLEQVGLAQRIHHRSSELSGGEQQRVAIARALFNEPQVVLADEPTGNLDERTSDGIQQLIWKLNRDRGTTFVIVTHEENMARQAHTWFTLVDGMVKTMVQSK